MKETTRDARRLLRPLQKEILGLVQALVRVDSVAIPPDGHETAAQKVLRAALKPYRLDVEMYDTGFLERSRHAFVRRDRHYTGRHNLIARRPGRGKGRSLLLSGHIDTVPVGHDPWKQSAPGRGRFAMADCMAAAAGT